MFIQNINRLRAGWTLMSKRERIIQNSQYRTR